MYLSGFVCRLAGLMGGRWRKKRREGLYVIECKGVKMVINRYLVWDQYL